MTKLAAVVVVTGAGQGLGHAVAADVRRYRGGDRIRPISTRSWRRPRPSRCATPAGRALGYRVDVADEASVAALGAATEEASGR